MDERRILIVDPDPKFRQRLAISLRSEGYHPETSNCLTAAIQKMTEGCYQCVVMSVNLPEIDGYKAVSVIKKMDPEVNIIMTTERNTRQLEAKVREQNVYYYFLKSFGLDELKTAIKSLFSDNVGKEVIRMKPQNSKAKILVIDDDPDFVQAVTMVLRSGSYDVVTADGPKEGEQKVLTEKPDLILLDIMMDSLFDGFSLCDEIKRSKKFEHLRNTPIIFVSAVKEKAGSRFAFNPREQGMVGPNDYIDKPVQPDDLLARIERLLEKKQ